MTTKGRQPASPYMIKALEQFKARGAWVHNAETCHLTPATCAALKATADGMRARGEPKGRHIAKATGE